MFVVRKIYKEDEIQEIIKKVEASKPWDGLLCRINLLITRFYHYFLFTLFGWNFACFLSLYYNLPKEFSISLNLGNNIYYVNLLVVLAFFLLDVLFYFLPSRYEKMSEGDHVREILTQEHEKWRAKLCDIGELNLFLYFCANIATAVWGGLFYCFLLNFIFFFSLAIIYKKNGFLIMTSLFQIKLKDFIFKRQIGQFLYVMPLIIMIDIKYCSSYVFYVYVQHMKSPDSNARLCALLGIIIVQNLALFYHHTLKGAYISRAMAEKK